MFSWKGGGFSTLSGRWTLLWSLYFLFFLYEFYYGELWFAELEITQQTHLMEIMRAHEASAQLCEIIQNETDFEKKEIEWFLTWWFDSKVICFLFHSQNVSPIKF